MSDVRPDPDAIDYRRFYADAERVVDYDRLVGAEDFERRLLPALASLVDLDDAAVLEVGVGTGRVTELLLGAGARVIGCEPAEAMCAAARRRLARYGADRLALFVEGVHDLSLPSGQFDLAVAGWVLGHFIDWHGPRWRDEIDRALVIMDKALAPNGVLAIIETLGTGQSEPTPPTSGLAEFYTWLERERGFHRTVVRTDYLFADVDSAASIMRAFFGPDMAAHVRALGRARVPECTGIWSRRKGRG